MATGPKYRHERSIWTTFTGWGMLLSALGSAGCLLAGVGSHPPLYVELGLAALAVLFAAAWILSSVRAPGRGSYWRRSGPAISSPRPVRSRRALVWLLTILAPLATLACVFLGLLVPPDYARETARLEAAGLGEYSVAVVRLAGEPVRGHHASDEDVFYRTDLVLRVPFDSGPREVTLPAMFTRFEPPTAGMTIGVYFAPGDPRPDSPVSEDGRRPRLGALGSLIALYASAVLGVMAPVPLHHYLTEDLSARARRFSPARHLPALGILLLGLLLALPTALGLEASGHARLLAFLACLCPGGAMAWVWRRPAPGA
ncbi:hypothetical protein [Streptomyces sp. NPDC058657]|uniref:hypothetical protein n=1 Tax=unclassified Streptomyces TaxID=2593676 RepID=UPI003665A90F